MPGSATAKARYHYEGTMGALHRFWQKSYAPDWLGVLLIALENLAITFFEPFHRMFSLDNRDIQYPHAEIERVPVPMLLTYAIGTPLLVIALYTLLTPSKHLSTPSRLHRLHLLHVSLLGLTISLMLTTFVTDLIKNGVGRPRPDLIARCLPRRGTPKNELVSWEVCTQTDHHTLHDGFRSFPSGHSSFSWGGLGYLSLFLAGQLGAWRRGAGMMKVVIVGLPAVGATLVTVSRTEDYRHDVFDVCAGSLIGIGIGYYSYRRYFPALTSKHSNVPYKRGEDDDEHGSTGDSRGDFEMLPRLVDSPDLEMGGPR
ncbi:PAP2 domain protein [Morchella snyderi]|nr:PAP2 domain protein [Morchella snyderi]